MRKYLSILLLITSFSVPGWSETTPQQIVLSDLHSRLNPTLVIHFTILNQPTKF